MTFDMQYSKDKEQCPHNNMGHSPVVPEIMLCEFIGDMNSNATDNQGQKH